MRLSLTLSNAIFFAVILQHKSETSSSQSTIDSSTRKQLSELDAAVAKNREEVIKKIVERVVKCEPQLHPNLKKVEA